MHDVGCPGGGDECGCSTFVHYDCLGGGSATGHVTVEHLLEVTHPRVIAGEWATIVGGWSMGQICPLVAAVHAASKYDLLVTFVDGATIAAVQAWMRENRATGVQFAQAWLHDNADNPPMPPTGGWARVNNFWG